MYEEKMMKEQELKKIKQRFGIIGHAPGLNHAIEIAARVANTNIGTLITGENGSGKESIAKIIHELSLRKHGNFIAINCGAIPEGTIDSELFGHEKGAFTSASETRKGYFEESDEGSLFLDEIGEMPLHTQPRLLRILENKEYFRVGSSQKRSSNARVIAATNINLKEYVVQKKFREDLYHRIAQIEITIPPLRERGEDIHLLFRKFALDFAQKHQTPLLQLTPEAKKKLMSYAFPGNIRQLKNIVWQIATLENAQENISQATLQKYLPDPIMPTPINVGQMIITSNKAQTEKEMIYKIILDMQQEIQAIKKVLLQLMQQKRNTHDTSNEHPQLLHMLLNPAKLSTKKVSGTSQALLASPSPKKKPQDKPEEELSLKYQEQKLIEKALSNAKSYKEAAQTLGIALRTLFRKVKKYNLSRTFPTKKIDN